MPGALRSRARLSEGTAEADILRAIASAGPFLPLALILRIVDIETGRYDV